MFPPLFTLNLPEEDQIIKDLEDIERMQTIYWVCDCSYYNTVSDF